MSFLGGSKPKTKTFQLDTVNPQQKAGLNELISSLRTKGLDEGRNSLGLSTETNPSSLESLSLAGLEERSLEMSKGGSATEQATSQALLNLISSGGGEVGGETFENFFQSNVSNPLREDYSDTMTGLGRAFGGNEFFGSERRDADNRATEDFLDSLSTSRADLAFQERNESGNRLINAIDLGQREGVNRTNQLAAGANAAFDARQLEQQDIQAQLQKLALERGLDQDDINNMLNALNVRARENVVVSSGGASGAAGGVISAVGSIIGGALIASDRRLKKDLRKISEIKGLNLYMWNWNETAKNILGHVGSDVGFIAQEVREKYPEHVREVGFGFLGIDYQSLVGDLFTTELGIIH